MADHTITDRQRAILEYIEITMRERGYPPAVREIGAAVGLNSPSTVHSHLAQLESAGYLRRDPTKPRAIEVCFDSSSGLIAERRPTRHVPLVGEVAAGTDVLAQENVEELVPVPEDFTGGGELFMLKVRGDSMIEAGINDGDTVIVRKANTADNGQIVVALIDEHEAMLKRIRKKGKVIALESANKRYETKIFGPDRVKVQGILISLYRNFQ